MLLRGRLLLPPDPMSVRRARRHIDEVLQEAGGEHWADDAMLGVSELVSNVVLHAHTDCEVAVELADDEVRVSVRDFDTSLPTLQHFSTYATTGHGLSLVGQLSAECGIDSLGEDGKVVWFLLRGVGRAGDLAVIDQEWDLTGLLSPDDETSARPTAVLAEVPVRLWLAGLEHHAAVLRELYLVQSGAHPAGPSAVEVAAADTALRALFEGTNRALERAGGQPGELDGLPLVPATGSAAPAIAAPPAPARVDVEVTLVALREALDLGQQLASQGQLLVRPALDELVTLRDWACDQVMAQSNGGTPTRWDNALLAGRSVGEWPTVDWDDTAVRSSPRPVVAGDDSNRIIAVSPPAAELLGGSPEDLVGLRITAIIPDRLRELHVAGFVRHLATGEGRVLGVRLNLPVLRLDGQEVLRCVLIEQQTVADGRSVYIAWLDPLPSA